MTREEAKREFWKKNGVFERLFEYCFDRVLKLPYKGRVIDIFIDKIYDDIESRTCKNCIYYNPETNLCLNQDLQNKELGVLFMPPSKSFGCNKFKRKVDEQDNQEDN